jgi:hypothetical protein
MDSLPFWNVVPAKAGPITTGLAMKCELGDYGSRASLAEFIVGPAFGRTRCSVARDDSKK